MEKERVSGDEASDAREEIHIRTSSFCRKCAEYCEFNAIVVIPAAGYAKVNPSLCHSCGTCLLACTSEAKHVQYETTLEIESYLVKQSVPVLCKIPFDTTVVKAMLNGHSIHEFDPDSEISHMFANARNKLLLENEVLG